MDPIKKSIRQQLIERRVKKSIAPEVEDVDIVYDQQDEQTTLMMHEINNLHSRVDYLSSLNSDLVDFLHSLVKNLDHENDLDLGEARRDFTVLLNRSGRRKFYQQQKRL
tara:strand:- start:388 stop:714 length:327 start_codon:yes stop_codon:yes gene_type:complete